MDGIFCCGYHACLFKKSARPSCNRSINSCYPSLRPRDEVDPSLQFLESIVDRDRPLLCVHAIFLPRLLYLIFSVYSFSPWPSRNSHFFKWNQPTNMLSNISRNMHFTSLTQLERNRLSSPHGRRQASNSGGTELPDMTWIEIHCLLKKGTDNPTCQLFSNQQKQKFQWDGQGRTDKGDGGGSIS